MAQSATLTEWLGKETTTKIWGSHTEANNADTANGTRFWAYFSSRFANYAPLYDDDVFDRILTAKILGANAEFIKTGQTLKMMSGEVDYYAKTETTGQSDTEIGYEGYNASGTYQRTSSPSTSSITENRPWDVFANLSQMAQHNKNLYQWADNLVLDLFRTIY